MIILCDFDGTITERDLTDLIWDRYVPGEERRIRASRVASGRSTMHEFIGWGYSQVPRSSHEVLAEMRPEVRIRPGFERFVTHAAGRGWSVHIVSCGLDFYIREFLPKPLPTVSFCGRYESSWHIELPPGLTLRPGEELKPATVRRLLAEGPTRRSIYVGDGPADLEPALLCDHVFAVEGSRLERRCRAAGRVPSAFRTFDEITAELQRMSEEGSPLPVPLDRCFQR